jgi:hypothetical protein
MNMRSSLNRSRYFLVFAFVALIALLNTAPAFAQSDEIQVYDGGLAPVGVFNLTVHNNYTPDGIKGQAFPGANSSNHSLNGVPEWAYGVTEWFEAGLYLPLYSHDPKLGFVLDGFKLRALFAVPHADDRKFFYGANFEFSFNTDHWDPKSHSSEVRPIIGWHLKPVDIIINPIFDTEYDGLKNLEFVPSTRVAYNVNDKTQLAVEEYDDFGPIHKFLPSGEQTHQIFAVIDHSTKFLDIEAGVGLGMTDASDKFQLKLILSKDLNARRSSGDPKPK